MIKINKISSGAVSLFIVIFATLLITVVTVSFVRIMIQGQQQVSSTDLSQSAYDSAQAGVEDAKRALLFYQSVCNSGSGDCSNVRAQIDSLKCNDAVRVLADIPKTGDEIKVETGGNSNSLDQAYTCVKIKMDTNNYLGSLNADESKLIPLKGVSAFDSITIDWFTMDDATGFNNIDVPSSGVPLFAQSSWKINHPPVMIAQLIQVGSEFSLKDFDDDAGTNTDTLFLYPYGMPSRSLMFSDDKHKVASNSPMKVECSNDAFSGGGYACTATITLPQPIGGGNRNAFLNLSALYNKTSYRVTLKNAGTTAVNFDAVQPEIDSTGRTSDMFRRVKSRVEFSGTFPYPQAAVDINGNLCKNFFVTDNPVDHDNYKSIHTCTP